MNIEILFDFLYNILLIMSMAVVYSVFKNDSFFHPIIRKVLMGLMTSIIVAFVMFNSYVLTQVDEGAIFDARTVVLSLSGMFFGGIPTIMAMVTATIIRLFLGGSGTLTGVLWIFVSSILGLTWRRVRLKKQTKLKYEINWIELYLFSLALQIIMVLLFFTMPNHLALPVINEVAFPLLVVYPIGATFVSQFLLILRRQHFSEINMMESERQYRRLFTKNKTNLFLIDAYTGDIVDANDASIETYGYSLDQFNNMNITQLNLLDSEEVMKDFDLARTSKKSFFQFKHIKKSGEIFDVEVHTSPVVIQNKEYIYNTVIDISDKVQSERMFKDADERLHTTLLSVGEGVVVTDEHERITLVNKKALDIVRQKGSLQRKKVFNEFRIYSNKNEKSFQEIYDECIETNTMFRSDNTYSLITNDEDKTIFIDFTISPVNNEHGVNHGAIIVLRDVTIEKERQEEIRFMSRHDYLTKLYNRYNFEIEMQRLDTERQLPISMIIGDINGLKLLNDAFGHLEGDKLIKEVADIFKKATRAEDIVARWGGDEFAILLPQTDKKGAESVKNRIKDLCRKSKYDVITPSVSIGIATKHSTEQSITEILISAEEHMYNNKMEEGPKMREELLDKLLGMLNARVLRNEEHSRNVEKLVEDYCTYYKYSEEETDEFKLLAKYHDIGRIGIEEEILNKVEPLNDYEWSRIKSHSEIGSRLVATIPELQHLSTIILQHHERYDGKGYPQGLKGNKITEKARLLAVLDSYEAMTHDRTYRKAKTHEEAITELLKAAGTQFDPEIIENVIRIFNKQKND